MMSEDIKIAVVGPGGVGGYFGGLLARAGMNVHFLGKGEHLESIKKRGLKVESYKGDFRINTVASDDPADIGISNIVLFCVKSFDTRETAEQIKPIVGKATTIISLQNGIDNEEILGAVFGREKIMGGVAFIGSRIKEPGVIIHTAAGGITLGEVEGGTSERGERLLEVFKRAGIDSRLSNDIRKVMWQKMVWNCGFNAITALAGCTVGEALSVSETKRVIKAAMVETVNLARAAGIDLDEELPDKTIAHTEKQGEIRTSMLIDMESGRRLEIEALNGEVSKKGGRLGIPTPVNDTLYGIVKAINEKRRAA